MSEPVILEPVTDPDVVRAARLAELANEERAALATLTAGYDRDVALWLIAAKRAALLGEPAPEAPVETIRVAYLVAALAQINKRNAVDAHISDPVLRALWDRATEIRRDDPDMAAVAAALNVDLSDVWARARAIRAARVGG
jgi:hypothetical protein